MRRVIEGQPFVGREVERKVLETLARQALAGDGSVVLISGEAGIGKSLLVAAALAGSGLAVRTGRARRDDQCAWLEGLPSDAEIDILDRQRPAAVVLDDMQWAGGPQLTRLPAIARRLAAAAVMLVVVHRDDELGSDHPLRPLRAQLRHERASTEIVLGAFEVSEVAALCTAVHGNRPWSASVVDAVHRRSEGVPLFAAELAAAWASADSLASVDDLRMPESLCDTVLLRAAGLSRPARGELSMLALGGSAGLPAAVLGCGDELLDCGLVVTTAAGGVCFRRQLALDVIREAIPRSECAALHAELATRLGTTPASAEHRLAAGDVESARSVLEVVISTRFGAGAVDDAMTTARRLLDLAGDDAERRVQALTWLAECAERLGKSDESARHWTAVARACRDWDPAGSAQAWRRAAVEREIDSRWEEALVAREEAAVAFTAAGQVGDAAQERLAAAAHLRSAASFRAALALLTPAARDAAAADRIDLQLRVLALEGNVRARMGDGEIGVELVRNALAGALERDLGAVAAEAYQRLADSLEHCGDYTGAQTTYDAAAAFCETQGARPVAELCRACLAVVLRQTGDWSRALATAREVVAGDGVPAHARCAAGCTIGVVSALRGDLDVARAELHDADSLARQIDLTAGEILCRWGLAIVATTRDSPEALSDACHRLLERWRASEDRHFAISPLRWAVTALVERGDTAEARACAEALAQIAADSGHREALSALAHALGEMAMVDGDWSRAKEQFTQAGRLLHGLGEPFERMESARRAGAALLADGRRDEAVDELFVAYRLARRLRARPSIQRLATDLAELGERVDRRLSRQQAEQLASAQLTRRELEVLHRLVAGETNREIATGLILSVRTVDMHVRNILRKLDCRTRTDAARRAGELRLVASP